jgi:hypothetical protein
MIFPVGIKPALDRGGMRGALVDVELAAAARAEGADRPLEPVVGQVGAERAVHATLVGDHPGSGDLPLAGEFDDDGSGPESRFVEDAVPLRCKNLKNAFVTANENRRMVGSHSSSDIDCHAVGAVGVVSPHFIVEGLAL